VTAWAARLVWAGAVLVAGAVPEAVADAAAQVVAEEVAEEVAAGAAAAAVVLAVVAAAEEAAPTHSGAGRLTGSSRPSATGGARNRCTPVRYSWT
jgi:hypothetical protein